MKTILQTSTMILLMAASNFAQQPQQPGFKTRLQSIVRQNGPALTKNYRLELTIQHGQKSASYRLTLNGGSVNTELIDRFAEKQEGLPVPTISFNATLTPFEEGGAEVQVNLGRFVVYKGKTQVKGAPPGTEKEVTMSKSIPLMTKVALFQGKPVILFEDEDEKISLKLTELASEAEKP